MAWAYYATVTYAHGTQPYVGLLKGDPEIETSIPDPLYGLVEYRDIRFTLLNDGRFSPTTVRNLRGQQCNLTLVDATTGATLTGMWNGMISSAAMNGMSEVICEGSIYNRAILSQLVPNREYCLVTATNFPNAIPGDIGKVASVVYGYVEKLKCLLVSDGVVANQYDYLVRRGTGDSTYLQLIHAVWRDDLNQGASGDASGTQSFRLVDPSQYSMPTDSGFTILRFTTRQISDSGALVGIYVDASGFQAEKHPIQGIRYFLSLAGGGGLSEPVNAASFDAAAAQWDALNAPDSTSLDIVIGANGQQKAAQEYLREWLMITGAHLGLNSSGEWAINLGLPPTTTTLALGSGTLGMEQNIVNPGVRTWASIENRAKSVTLKYRLYQPTGTYQLSVARTLDTVGREIVLEMPSIRTSAMADRVVDRIAKRLYYAQERITGVQMTLEGWNLDQTSWVTYTDRGNGCYQDVFRCSRVLKTLTAVTVDLERVSPSIWQYTPAALPTESVGPPIDSPPPTPTPVSEEKQFTVMTDSLYASTSYQGITTYTPAYPTLTIDTTGNDLYIQGFLELLVLSDPVAGTGTVRLSDSTGANVEVAVGFGADNTLFPGYTVWTARFPAASLVVNQTSVTAGVHSAAIEFKTSFIGQEVFYGSTTVVLPGLPSEGYVLMRESV